MKKLLILLFIVVSLFLSCNRQDEEIEYIMKHDYYIIYRVPRSGWIVTNGTQIGVVINTETLTNINEGIQIEWLEGWIKE